MYKLIIMIAIFLIVLTATDAQILMTPFGSSSTNGTQSNCYTSGEVIIRTIEDSDYNATQGFQQPEVLGKEEIELEIYNGIVLGDQNNQVFFIKNLDQYSNNSLQIFNRWGELVFEASPYKNDWTGTFNDETLPSATYYYILYLDIDKKKEKHGNVYILDK